jgi:hypothetical protein
VISLGDGNRTLSCRTNFSEAAAGIHEADVRHPVIPDTSRETVQPRQGAHSSYRLAEATEDFTPLPASSGVSKLLFRIFK